MSAALALENLTKRYGPSVAVDRVTLDVKPSEFVVLLGPSGCGKTTTLRLIAGFVPTEEGDIRIDGRSIVDLPPHRRAMGVVFQSYALFPHLTVEQNVRFGLEMRSVDRRSREARAAEMLELVKLSHLSGRLPRQLSGGQQQRVAIARALAIEPDVLLLDEPLSNLDAALRLQVAHEIRLLQRSRNLTTIMVTHDQNEAMAMADRLVVMRDGKIEQVGTQEDLYENPQTPFVARFIGHSNLIAGRMAHGRLDVSGASLPLAAARDHEGQATLALRPERILVRPITTSGPQIRAVGHVELSTYLGAHIEHVVRVGDELAIVARTPSFGPDAGQRFAPGEEIALSWSHDSERVFDEQDVLIPAIPLIHQQEFAHHG